MSAQRLLKNGLAVNPATLSRVQRKKLCREFEADRSRRISPALLRQSQMFAESIEAAAGLPELSVHWADGGSPFKVSTPAEIHRMPLVIEHETSVDARGDAPAEAAGRLRSLAIRLLDAADKIERFCVARKGGR